MKNPYAQQYSQVPSQGNPRQTEAWALTESARRMKLAQASDDAQAILAAIRLNWRLWTIFQAELSSPDSPLPLDLRSNMLSLCNFVDKATVDVISNPTPEKLDIFISINRELAAGLFVEAQNSAPSELPSDDVKESA